jgi:putative ABC transport system substrate-binding protein
MRRRQFIHVQGLREFGWTEGRNVRFEYRFSVNVERIRAYAKETVELSPDLTIAHSSLIAAPHVVLGPPTIDVVAALAARYQLPCVYPFRFWIAGKAGLMSYGVDVVDLFRKAAGYADRILRGAKPGDLPVQNPTKYELVINLRTAKALDLNVPPTLLARPDELIE